MSEKTNHDEDGSYATRAVALACFLVGFAWGELERLARLVIDGRKK